MSTPTHRQLPGVKGQWILCSDCPPTAADADRDGDVCVWPDGSDDWRYLLFSDVAPSDYWLPACWDCSLKEDLRPFTLEPVSTPPATTERRIVQLACHPEGTAIYAVADDGTVWVLSETIPDWSQIENLPPRDA